MSNKQMSMVTGPPCR